MAKMYNAGAGELGGGQEIGVPTVKRQRADGKIGEFVRIPALYTGCVCHPNGATGKTQPFDGCKCGKEQFVEHEPGAIYVSIPDRGFFQVKKGDAWELPPGISVKTMKSMCPHLISEEEYLHGKQSEKKQKPQQSAA